VLPLAFQKLYFRVRSRYQNSDYSGWAQTPQLIAT
jgi:hypothetical protein